MLSQLGNKASQRSHPTSQLLHFLEGLWWTHVFNGLHLFWVGLNPPMGHQETQQLAERDAKHAFLRIEPQVHLAKAFKGLL